MIIFYIIIDIGIINIFNVKNFFKVLFFHKVISLNVDMGILTLYNSLKCSIIAVLDNNFEDNELFHTLLLTVSWLSFLLGFLIICTFSKTSYLAIWISFQKILISQTQL